MPQIIEWHIYLIVNQGSSCEEWYLVLFQINENLEVSHNESYM